MNMLQLRRTFLALLLMPAFQVNADVNTQLILKKLTNAYVQGYKRSVYLRSCVIARAQELYKNHAGDLAKVAENTRKHGLKVAAVGAAGLLIVGCVLAHDINSRTVNADFAKVFGKDATLSLKAKKELLARHKTSGVLAPDLHFVGEELSEATSKALDAAVVKKEAKDAQRQKDRTNLQKLFSPDEPTRQENLTAEESPMA